MDLDEELDTMEDGAETEAEQTDEETELQDLEDFEDEGPVSYTHLLETSVWPAGPAEASSRPGPAPGLPHADRRAKASSNSLIS